MCPAYKQRKPSPVHVLTQENRFVQTELILVDSSQGLDWQISFGNGHCWYFISSPVISERFIWNSSPEELRAGLYLMLRDASDLVVVRGRESLCCRATASVFGGKRCGLVKSFAGEPEDERHCSPFAMHAICKFVQTSIFLCITKSVFS